MRDRSASRRYSAAAEEFRRVHRRHRDWGKRRGHIERLRQVRGCSYAEAAAVVDGVRHAMPPQPPPAVPPHVAPPPAPGPPSAQAAPDAPDVRSAGDVPGKPGERRVRDVPGKPGERRVPDVPGTPGLRSARDVPDSSNAPHRPDGPDGRDAPGKPHALSACDPEDVPEPPGVRDTIDARDGTEWLSSRVRLTWRRRCVDRFEPRRLTPIGCSLVRNSEICFYRTNAGCGRAPPSVGRMAGRSRASGATACRPPEDEIVGGRGRPAE
ncbi:hypothetical protein J2S43_002876 [Catenuloplanes nepalensis]|uniref:Uncharacterized protein n=1 Tax=Catenuloplanes nepalensis TaxID=587533 RepID=A0ABT9MSE7_9ACTN|nr:hypothetical protein [Catenuloplanes nepalensis]